MSLDLDVEAANICSCVGEAFPERLDHRGEMVLRQLLALAEEAAELDEALELYHELRGASVHDQLAGEIVDTIMTAHMVAFYIGQPLQPVVDNLKAVCAPASEAPYRVAGRAVKAGRRFLGVARRSGTLDALYRELATLVLTCETLAKREVILLDQAVAAKLQIIYSRGWKEPVSR
jgi:hypothetical protein